MSINYLKNYNQSEFSTIFDKHLFAIKKQKSVWCGTVYVGTQPLYVECTIQWIADRMEQYFTKAYPNVHIQNSKELYVSDNLETDVAQISEPEDSYVCFLGDDIYKKPDMVINKHCLFIKHEHKYVMCLYKNDFNILYLGENHLLNKLFNYIFDDTNFMVLHGAVIGHNNQGVLITGLSGYGKSTLAAHCLSNGMQFVGDDRIALEKKPDGLFAYPIYTTLSIGDNIPQNLDIIKRQKIQSNAKEILVLSKSQLSENIKITAVIEPHRTNNHRPKITPTKKPDVITRICKDYSLLNAITPSKNPFADWKKIFNLLSDIEFYTLELGSTIADNAGAIVDFLHQRNKNV